MCTSFSTRYFLQTSPEFVDEAFASSGPDDHLPTWPGLSGGRERGQYHNPEFTMLEWYRVGESLAEALEFLGRLVDEILAKHQLGGCECDCGRDR